MDEVIQGKKIRSPHLLSSSIQNDKMVAPSLRHLDETNRGGNPKIMISSTRAMKKNGTVSKKDLSKDISKLRHSTGSGFDMKSTKTLNRFSSNG